MGWPTFSLWPRLRANRKLRSVFLFLHVAADRRPAVVYGFSHTIDHNLIHPSPLPPAMRPLLRATSYTPESVKLSLA
jgi:hypothetical protein